MVSRAAKEWLLRNWRLWLPLACLWLVVVRFLGAQWSVYEQYRYGWAVPFLALWFAWRRTAQARVEAKNRGVSLTKDKVQPPPAEAIGGAKPKAEVPKRSATVFWAMMVLLALLYIPVRIIQESNPVWRGASYALCLIACGLALGLLFARGGVPWVRRYAFPVGLMLVGVPWPSGVENIIIQRLSGWNTALTAELLSLLGLPVLAHGNLIETAGGAVGVEEACSGIRSLQASVMLALAFGEFHRLRFRQRVGLVGAGAAFAFVFNLVRTALLTWVAARQGVEAIARWHDPAGVTILLGCFVSLWGAAVWAGRARARGKQGMLGIEDGAGRPPAAELKAVTSPNTERSKCPPAEPPEHLHPVFPRLAVGSYGPMLLFCWLLVAEAAAEVWFRSHQHLQQVACAWTVAVPEGPTRYRDLPLTDRVRDWLGCDEHASLVWESDEGYRWQLFYFRWLPAQGLTRTAQIALSRTHRPDHCLPASGRTLLRELELQEVEIGTLRLPFRVYTFDDQGTLLLVFHCLWEDGTRPGQIANLRENTRARLAAAWAGSRGVGQRSLQVAVWGYPDLDAARSALADELKHLVRTGQGP